MKGEEGEDLGLPARASFLAPLVRIHANAFTSGRPRSSPSSPFASIQDYSPPNPFSLFRFLVLDRGTLSSWSPPIWVYFLLLLFCKQSALLQTECSSANRVLFCKQSTLLQTECSSVNRVLFCKQSALLQTEYSSANRVLFCKQSALLQTEYSSANGVLFCKQSEFYIPWFLAGSFRVLL